jgi:GGDEF domain-containing protein
VFRVGGDEFAIIAKEEDYDKIDDLMSKFLDINLKSREEGGVVIAGGLSRFDGDECVNDVFKRADELMYENKKKLKEG